jgi:hypothetical protein
MKSPDYYQTEANHCRRDALGLALFAAACLLALLLIGSGLKSGPYWWVPLALLCGLVTAAGGAMTELAESRRLRRIARMEQTFQPLERL